MIYLLTAIRLSAGGSSTVHIYTQTVIRTSQNKQYIEQHNNLWECGPCPVLVRFTLAFALQLREKHGKTSVRVKTSVREEYYKSEHQTIFGFIHYCDRQFADVVLKLVRLVQVNSKPIIFLIWKGCLMFIITWIPHYRIGYCHNCR